MDLKTSVPLHDLGELRPEWKGILSPRYGDDLINRYIHGQFLENASTYAARYADTAHWKALLRNAQSHFQIESSQPLILDIGSGAGNSVFPLLELYPQATIVASDLSAQLLQILKDYLGRHFPQRSCPVIQLNCEELIFTDGQFDMVCGGSILHHLLKPEKTVFECQRILKPGGVAVFFEPFEIGYQVLALALERLIEMNAHPPAGESAIAPDVIRFFEALCLDFRVRKDRVKDDQLLAGLDDKWLFTDGYFQHVGRAAGFEETIVYSINAPGTHFSQQLWTLLKLGVQKDASALPPWAHTALQKMDRHFSPDLCEELMFEGCVLFKKASRLAQLAAA